MLAFPLSGQVKPVRCCDEGEIMDTLEGYWDKRYLAELVGTLALVLVGCAAITISGFGGAFPLAIISIGLAFGLTVMAMVYGLGPISGAHLNPAVTVSIWSIPRAVLGRQSLSAARRCSSFGCF
jgi:Major intrinsic protein